MSEKNNSDNTNVSTIIINWSLYRYTHLLLKHGVPNVVKPEYPQAGTTTSKPLKGKTAPYVEYFTECNFRIPLAYFVINLL